MVKQILVAHGLFPPFPVGLDAKPPQSCGLRRSGMLLRILDYDVQITVGLVLELSQGAPDTRSLDPLI